MTSIIQGLLTKSYNFLETLCFGKSVLPSMMLLVSVTYQEIPFLRNMEPDI